METQLQIKLNHQEKDLIKRAGKIIGLGHSTFARMVCLEKAREILKLNQAEAFA